MRVLTAGKAGRLKDSYTCQTGYHVRRSRPDLDDLVTRLVVARLALPDAAAALARDDGDQAQEAREKAAALRARLDLAADSYAEGDIDSRQLTRITSRLRPEMEQWELASRAATTAPDLRDLAAPDIAQRWDRLPLARKRAVIDLLLDIKVNPTQHGGHNLFDPDSVCIEWKTS
jgi:site-specific DNA recombinase